MVTIIRKSGGAVSGSKYSHFVSNSPAKLSTVTMDQSYYGISFVSSVYVIPTYYTISHSIGSKSELRNWNLEGSLDGEIWTILSQHKDDNTIQAGVHETHSWRIDSTAQFSKFRIRSTGKQVGNHFAVSGFELYGTMSVNKTSL